MTKNEAKGIWVFAEQRHGTLDKTALELLGKAAELKAVNGEPVTAILAGCGVEALAATLIAHGADRVIVAESEALNSLLLAHGTTPVSGSARMADLVRRPQIGYDLLAPFDPTRPALSKAVREQVEIQLKYAGYIARQEKQVAEFQKAEGRRLPPDADYTAIQGLRLEARQKLQEMRPLSIGQASRISGVSPADVAVLLIWLEQQK